MSSSLGLGDWSAVSSFPSVIHMELLAKGIIQNPNVGENERSVQWVGEADWDYQTTFRSPPKAVGRCLELVFEGLDTFATVYLNGEEVLRSSNMFLPARIPAGSSLKPPGETNELLVRFESACKIGTALEEQHGTKFSRMRDRRRNHVRKAQVSFTWLKARSFRFRFGADDPFAVPLGLGLGASVAHRRPLPARISRGVQRAH